VPDELAASLVRRARGRDRRLGADGRLGHLGPAFLGGLALVFTAVHVLAVLVDSYVHFSLVNVLVPLTGDWHPLAVAWGIVGLYLLLAVELTSLAIARLPRRLWRRVHMASFALFAATSVHALTAGTDRHSPPFQLAVALSIGLVALLTALRVWQASLPRPAPAGARQRDVSAV
jgi:hypothetical protein